MGSILTATIGTRPLLVFYVHLVRMLNSQTRLALCSSLVYVQVVVLMSSALLLLVRDADGYQKTHDA